ncbi:MAG: transglutaminase domain-containing protein [Candidatus Nanoarchaeia archaeon]|nr:transglutaminase domain-containing protein [Candidatus Nanoarchaeia archaeon]
MKKRFVLLLLAIFLSGCTIIEQDAPAFDSSSGVQEEDLTQGANNLLGESISELNDSNELLSLSFTSPISRFTSQDVALLGVDCEGEKQEIAQCIKDWQVNNMDYDASKPDSSYSIRWNYAFPGLYPSNEIIREKTLNGRIYGICIDFALIYCSIADYYGLTCRVSNSITKPSDKDASLLEYATGLGMEEYDDLMVKLRSKGMDYSYELLRQIMRETPEHYWAEVYLNDEWVIYDATNILIQGSNTIATYVDENDWEATVWDNDNTADLLSAYTPNVDDLGQTGKSWTIDDYFGSKTSGRIIPVPYYDSCSNVCGFFDGKNPACALECPFLGSFYDCYDSCSGEKFYKICDFICTNDDEIQECYLECSGEELNINCFNDC